MKRRGFLTHSLRLATGSLSLAFAGAAGWSVASPAQGPRVVDLELFDADRQRPVPARLYLPQQASAESPVPLIVFSHGLGGSRMGYRYLGSHWSEQGMASLHPQHVGSDSALWRGNPLDLVQRLQAAASELEALARVLDLRFALDQVLASDIGPQIDASSIAVAGHSYGANTAMLVSGARVTAAGTAATDLQDPRIRSAILISAPPLSDQGPVEQVLGAVSLPTLHITSVEDTITLPGYRSTVEDRIRIFQAMSGSPRTLAVFNKGGHSIFTDRTTRSGPETSARIKGATRELCTIFLRQSLLKRARQPLAAGVVVRPTSDSRPTALEATREGDPDIKQWLLRHEDLVDRFVMPDPQG
jgi:predicted dienelactone hydrolase